ncbi:MAG: DNA translocase FtsK 4TM domain-containing protein [Alphaproteobacteria bacterium]
MFSSFLFVLRGWSPVFLKSLLFLGALFLGLAFLSYDPGDPSWNFATFTPVENWLGMWGAQWSDTLLQLVGVAAYTIPCFCVFLVFQERAKGLRLTAFYLFAIPLLSFASAGFFPPELEKLSFTMPHGGALGFLLQQGLIQIFPFCIPFLGAFSLLFSMLGICSLFLSFGGTSHHLVVGCHVMHNVLSLFLDFFKRSEGVIPGRGYGNEAMSLAYEAQPAGLSGQREGEFPFQPVMFGQGSGPVPEIPAEGLELPSPDAFLKDYENAPQKKSFLTWGKKKGDAGPSKKVEALRSPLPEGQAYQLPPLGLLPPAKILDHPTVSRAALQESAQELAGVLDDFGIRGEIVQANPGPVVTLYELQPAAGLKSSRVISLADDIARSMSALSARVAVVAGRNIIGIELPNKSRETVYLRELLASSAYQEASQHLPLVLGKNIGGLPVIADLARMPHLLVAGTTGSGKSVGINAMILSLIFRLSPEQCKFIMIDPKMLELSVYDGIPHLLTPVVTDPKKAIVALKWVVREMENRYRAMAQLSVRNIENYNQRLREAQAKGESLSRKVQVGFEPETGEPQFETQDLHTDPLPFIVVVVDEMADLMLVAGKEIEAAVQRLAQMARAAGIHLIMATQRPSVDVITGTIKANFPTRISFQVTSKIDSRTILSEQGAEQLLGQGDMLYMASGGRITRVHGPFVSDADVEQVVSFLKSQRAPDYIEDITLDPEEGEEGAGQAVAEGLDSFYEQAVVLVRRDGKASTSYIQRHFQIGYNRAARIMDQMESEGVVSSPNHVGKREIL